MTRSSYRFFETEYPYFMTCTINSWLPIFTRQETADIIFDSWRFLQQEREFKLVGHPPPGRVDPAAGHASKLGAKNERFNAALDPNDILEVLKKLSV